MNNHRLKVDSGWHRFQKALPVTLLISVMISLGLPQVYSDPLQDDLNRMRENTRRENNSRRDAKIKRSFAATRAAQERADQAEEAALIVEQKLEQLEKRLDAATRSVTTESRHRSTNALPTTAEEWSMSPGGMEVARRISAAQRSVVQQKAPKILQTKPSGHSGRAVRQMKDGSVSAIINGTSLRFNSIEEYKFHLAKIALEAKQQHDAEAAREEEFVRLLEASANRVFSKFPILADKKSMERLALSAHTANLMENPENAELFKDPNWPEYVAEEFTELHKIQPKQE